MEMYWASWLLMVTVFAAACVSPGPDFVMSVRNSLVHGRRAGVLTAIGFGLGVAVHATYALAGLGAVIAHSIILFTIIKYIGAGYLIYLGVQALRSKGASATAVESAVNDNTKADKTDWGALRDGFITNLFNPKATLFFVALFTQIIAPDMPAAVRIFFGATCALMVTSWFVFVTYMMTLPAVRARYLRLSKAIDRVLGAFLIAFGLKLALSRA